MNNWSCLVFKSVEFPKGIGVDFQISIRYNGFKSDVEECRDRFVVAYVS